jgi:phage gp36-like protein
MAYCAAADVTARYGPKALKWAGDDVAVMEAACADASGEIDGYLALAGVRLPLDPVPSYIANYAADLAGYLLVVRSGFLTGAEGEEEISKRAAGIRHFFEKWAEGKFDGGDKDGIPPGDPSRPSRVRWSTEPKLDLSGYR